jgi:hypothetical protein
MKRGIWCLYTVEFAFALAAAVKGFHDGLAALAAPPLSSSAGSLFNSAMISLCVALAVVLVVCVQIDVSRRRR